MFKYIKVSNAHYISLDNGKLYTGGNIKTPNTVYYPTFLDMTSKKSVTSFDFKGDDRILLQQNYSERTDTIKLNQVWIQYLSDNCVLVKFYDYRHKKKLWIKITTRYETIVPAFFTIHLSVEHPTGSYELSYNVLYDTICKVRDCSQKSLTLSSTVEENHLAILNRGLVAPQYKIKYNDVEFGGKSYAFLNETWGILLSDDLSIDAIFTIKALKNMEITVEHFIWTSNPFIAKQILIKQGGNR